MSGCRLSSAIREARIAFGNADWNGDLCGCCENTLLWDVETVFLYGCWSEVK